MIASPASTAESHMQHFTGRRRRLKKPCGPRSVMPTPPAAMECDASSMNVNSQAWRTAFQAVTTGQETCPTTSDDRPGGLSLPGNPLTS